MFPNTRPARHTTFAALFGALLLFSLTGGSVRAGHQEHASIEANYDLQIAIIKGNVTTLELKLDAVLKHLTSGQARLDQLNAKRDKAIVEFHPIRSKMAKMKRELQAIQDKLRAKDKEVAQKKKEYENASESEKDKKHAAWMAARAERNKLRDDQRKHRNKMSNYNTNIYGPKLAEVTRKTAAADRQADLVRQIHLTADKYRQQARTESARLATLTGARADHMKNKPNHTSHDDD